MLIAFISDIHEDFSNLQKALESATKQGVHKVICLGDVTGYSNLHYNFSHDRNASLCIQLLQEIEATIIVGNHDLFSGRRIPSYSAGITYPDNWFNLTPSEQREKTEDMVWLYEDETPTNASNTEIEWLISNPEFRIVQIDNLNLFCSHFLYPDLTGSLMFERYDLKNIRQHRKFASQKGGNYSFIGHLHLDGFGLFKAQCGWLSKHVNYGYKAFPFNREYRIEKNDCIAIPAITRNKGKSGLLYFDTSAKSVVARVIG